MKSKSKRGNCYVTCEALYHLLGGKAAGWVPKHLRHEDDTHWFLYNRNSGQLLDPTVSQFRAAPDYTKGVGSGFLTREPSRRAAELMEKLVWQT